jgi:hypothetical protein
LLFSATTGKVARPTNRTFFFLSFLFIGRRCICYDGLESSSSLSITCRGRKYRLNRLSQDTTPSTVSSHKQHSFITKLNKFEVTVTVHNQEDDANSRVFLKLVNKPLKCLHQYPQNH